MTTAMMSLETAPRDPAQLQGAGPFVHRRLGEALAEAGCPLWTDERSKSAFVTASTADRAQMLVTKLQEWDAKNGGAPAAAQSAPAAAQQEAPPPAQAAPQAAPNALPSGRSPQKAGAPAGAPPAGGAPAAGGPGVLELLTVVKALQGDIAKLSATAGTKAGSSEVQDLRAMVAASIKIQEVELGLLCLFGEQVLGATMADFMGDAIQYGQSALAAVSDKAGKAGG